MHIANFEFGLCMDLFSENSYAGLLKPLKSFPIFIECILFFVKYRRFEKTLERYYEGAID
jgi:hypothetical protein